MESRFLHSSRHSVCASKLKDLKKKKKKKFTSYVFLAISPNLSRYRKILLMRHVLQKPLFLPFKVHHWQSYLVILLLQKLCSILQLNL